MNTKDAIQQLISYFKKYGDIFIIHPEFLKELSSLLKKELKGNEKKFFQKFVTQLDNIVNFKRQVYTVDGNEILKAGNDEHGNPFELYSIHISSNNYNIRFIISFTESSSPVFLTAFYERGGKRKTDYTIPKQIAKTRIRELMKGNDEND